jgi:hypothetical protein
MSVMNRNEGYLLGKLQSGLTAIEEWCECCKNEVKCIRVGIPDTWYSLHNVRTEHPFHESCNILLCNIWEDYMKIAYRKGEAKTFITFNTAYSLLKSEQFRTNIKLTIHKALIRSEITYVGPSRNLLQIRTFWIVAVAKRFVHTTGKFPSCRQVL